MELNTNKSIFKKMELNTNKSIFKKNGVKY
jgi:hypothetical protein